jgi:hypothetical protein
MESRQLKNYCVATALVWSALIALLCGWSIYNIFVNTNELALIEARALFNKDKAVRFWASNHGGVYVPKTEQTPSNPFLAHIPERDITLPSGKQLTLMNPAYMLRQMMSEYEALYGAKGHITSLIHYRPETAPDEWETKALKMFEAGSKEIIEVSDIKGEPYLRLMQPLFVVKSCLKCHGVQGYKEGDIRGGVSLSVPLKHYYDVQNKTLMRQIAAFAIVWIIGLLFIGYTRKRIS